MAIRRSTSLGGALIASLSLAACGGDRAREVASAAAPVAVEAERADLARWLATAPASPYRAIVQHPIGDSVVLGPPDADVPLEGLGRIVVTERGARLTLVAGGATRPLGRQRLVPVGDHAIQAAGLPGRSTLTVFGPAPRYARTPEYYPISDTWRHTVVLTPPESGGTERLLAPDGVEVEATFAGTVRVPLADTTATLRVFRLPAGSPEETELEIYFRDATNGRGTYPAGRFVSLIPAGGERYVLDFNRARNPFCAYSAVYPCPAPWRGNSLAAAITAGERYTGGGLEVTPF